MRLKEFLDMYCVGQYEVYYNCESWDKDNLWLVDDALIYYICTFDDWLLIYISDNEHRPLKDTFTEEQMVIHLDSTGRLSYVGLYKNMPLRILGISTRSIYAEGGAIIFDERSKVYEVKRFSK